MATKQAAKRARRGPSQQGPETRDNRACTGAIGSIHDGSVRSHPWIRPKVLESNRHGDRLGPMCERTAQRIRGQGQTSSSLVKSELTMASTPCDIATIPSLVAGGIKPLTSSFGAHPASES